MRRVRLAAADVTFDPEDPPGFAAGMARFGGTLGAERTGATLYELPPGEALCPYHYEYGEEEWLFVLEGRPTIRTPEGREAAEPLDLVFFPMGPGGAHQVRNESEETVRVLMWSTVVVPTATAYPDSDKVGIWTGVEGDNVLVRRSSAVGYYAGEPGVPETGG